MCKPPQLERAAACYLQAGKASDAAECLAQAWLVERALAACSQARLYNLGLSLIHSWQKQIADGLSSILKFAREDSPVSAPMKGDDWKMRQELVTRLSSAFLLDAAKFFYRKKERGKMMKYVLQFPAAAEKRRFLERRDLFEELLQVEVAEGNFERAAAARLKKGDMLGAAEMFVQQKMWGRAFECAMEAARVASMWANGNNGWPLNSSSSSSARREEDEDEEEEEEDEDVGECARVNTGGNGWSWKSEVRKWISKGAAARVEGVEKEGQKSSKGRSRNALELAAAIWLTQEEASVCRGTGSVAAYGVREGRRGFGKEAGCLARSEQVGSAVQGEGAGEWESEVDAEQGLEALTLLLLSKRIQRRDDIGDIKTLWCRLTGWGGGRSIAAEVLCSWKALELSLEKFNTFLLHTFSSLSSASSLTSTTSPLPNRERLPSWLPTQRHRQAVQASPGDWCIGGGRPQGIQQVQRGERRSEEATDESWPGLLQQLGVLVGEVQRWWGEWSERVVQMVAALQRLRRRREVPADQPWLNAAFHFLAATPPTASSTAEGVSTAAHTAPPALDSPSHSILVGLSSAVWLLPVRAAVTRLPNQGTRGEVAREAAAEAGAIFWARQVATMVQGCLQALDLALCQTSMVLQLMGHGNELLLQGVGQLTGRVTQGGCKVQKSQQQQQQQGGCSREGISRALVLRLQCEWLVQCLGMLERALQCCNGRRKSCQRPHTHLKTHISSAADRVAQELDGAASMLERLQDSLARRLLQHVMPVGAPLPRDVALLTAEVRAQESTGFVLHFWALRLLAEWVGGATRQEAVTRDKEGVLWGSNGLGSDMQEPVLLALLGDLLLVLPLLGSRWVHRYGRELLQRQSSRPHVYAAVLRAVVHEDAVQSFLEQRHSHGAAVTLASTEWAAALLQALTSRNLGQPSGEAPIPLTAAVYVLEREVTYLAAAITKLRNFIIPTSLAALHLDNHRASALCTLLLQSPPCKIPPGHDHQLKAQLSCLHGLIKSLLQQQWWASSEAPALFLRLLTLLIASSANVPAFHNSTATFLRDLWHCNGLMLHQLPHLIHTEFAAVLGGNRLNPNALHDRFSWAMFKLGDPWIVLQRKGSPFIHRRRWHAKLRRFNVETSQVQSATSSLSWGAANEPHSPQVDVGEEWVPGADTCLSECSFFSLVDLTGREPAGHVVGGVIADWEAEGWEGREEEWEEEREGVRGGRSEEWGGAEGLFEEQGQEEQEEEVEEENLDLERMDGEEGIESVDAVLGEEGGYKRGSGDKGEGDEREEVDGVKIAVRVTATLRQLLSEVGTPESERKDRMWGADVLQVGRSDTIGHIARERLQQELPPLERSRREAKRGLSVLLQARSKAVREFYIKEYLDHASPLEVKASAFLALVHCAVLAVKARLSTVHVPSLEEQIERDEQLLDAATDAAEELEAALAVLNHAYVMKHKM
ncbi:unnamed protein product [Closterium sp. Naga37s-1]|nr:unnamed protein product [Closterium sp. Naga37s-1]